MHCETCGLPASPGTTIFSGCGGQLRGHSREPPGAHGERASGLQHAGRRPGAPLFCDLVDSVPRPVSLDPEDMMHVIDVYLSACDDIVARHGGTITQYMGDGVL